MEGLDISQYTDYEIELHYGYKEEVSPHAYFT
jgi:hypothetical protein